MRKDIDLPKRLLRSVALLMVALLMVVLAGCNPVKPDSNRPTATYQLATVVEAVQYAIDSAASDDAWAATKEEKEHWAQACKAATEASAKSCGSMRKSAEPVCEQSCGGDNCSPIDAIFCAHLASGKAFYELCESGAMAAGDQRWCDDARKCLANQKDQKRICNALKSIALPELQMAELSLKVEESNISGGGLTLLVVEFGGSATSSTASTVSLELKPRVRDEDYGAAGTLKHSPRTVSDNARNLAGNLSALITDAVNSGTLEYKNDGGVIVKPPLALSGFTIDLALTLTDDGKLTVGKEWDSLPAKIGLERQRKSTLANSLTLTYARKQ